MCTVTFIPFKESYFITSNRDESPGRRAKGLFSFHAPGKNTVHYPLDEESGGSWIALSDSGKVVCLLNGAFETYIPTPPYRQSRGQVVIDVISEPVTHLFLENYILDGIAPFTLIIFENKKLDQLIWDGFKKHQTELDISHQQIWSSVTLYTPEIRIKKKSLFDKWLPEQDDLNRESIIRFHQLANGDPDHDFIINRNEVVKTLSITSILLRPASASVLHMELDNSTREEILDNYE